MLVDNGLDLQYALDHLESDQPNTLFESGNVTVLGQGEYFDNQAIFISFIVFKNGIFFKLGSRENVSFEWILTPWSNCSQTCGSTVGFKVRARATYNTAYKYVKNN